VIVKTFACLPHMVRLGSMPDIKIKKGKFNKGRSH